MVSALRPRDRSERAAARFPWLVAATCLPFVLIVFSHHVRTSIGTNVATWVAGLTLAAHVPTTAAFYADRSLWPFMARNRTRFMVAPVIAIGVGATFAWLAPAGMLSTGFSLYIAWQLHHFTRQNLGMVSFLFRSSGRPALRGAERRLINITGVAGIFGFAPLYAGILGVGDAVREVLWWSGLAALVAATAWLALIWPTDPLRAVALSCVVIFYVPLYLYRDSIFPATFAYATAHGAQYLLMTGHLAAGRTRNVALRWVVAVAALAVIGGALLDQASVLGGTDRRWLYGLGLGVTAAHFIVDAGLWRLRDPDQRAWMRERFAFL